jgi:uncharacterized membrane protein
MPRPLILLAQTRQAERDKRSEGRAELTEQVAALTREIHARVTKGWSRRSVP